MLVFVSALPQASLAANCSAGNVTGAYQLIDVGKCNESTSGQTSFTCDAAKNNTSVVCTNAEHGSAHFLCLNGKFVQAEFANKFEISGCVSPG